MRSQNPLPPLVPRVFRKRLSAQRLAEISLVHHVNLDALMKGEDTALLNYAASVLTWRNVAHRLGVGEAEIAPQLELVESLLRRFAAHGKVMLDAADYKRARDGVIVMDQIAAEADMATAAWAAERSSAELRRRLSAIQRS